MIGHTKQLVFELFHLATDLGHSLWTYELNSTFQKVGNNEGSWKSVSLQTKRIFMEVSQL